MGVTMVFVLMSIGAVLSLGLALFLRHQIQKTGDFGLESPERLAMMLVLELKQKNEEMAMEAQRRGELPEALRQNVEHSRALYEERIAEPERGDYFDRAIDRLLLGR